MLNTISHRLPPFRGVVNFIWAQLYTVVNNRYNLLPLIAKHMGLDIRSDRMLWKDRALVELNIAVLSSFARHRVTIVDHHTASRQFLRHEELEQLAGRTVPAHWVWIV